MAGVLVAGPAIASPSAPRSAAIAASPTPTPAAPVAAAPAPVAAESLLELVPAEAVAVAVVRKGALSPLRTLLDRSPAMRAELSAYFEQSLGLDPTRIQGAVAWSTSLSQNPSFAVLLRMDGALSLKRPRIAASEATLGVDTYDLGNGLRAAIVPLGVLLGSEREVAVGVALLQKKKPAVSTAAPLGFLLAPGHADADLEVGLFAGGIADRTFATFAEQLGVRLCDLTFRDGALGLALTGVPEKLAQTRDLLLLRSNALLAELDKKRVDEKRGGDVVGAALAIAAYHQLKQLLDEATPRLAGDTLVARYTLPRLDGGSSLIPYLGAAGALVIPTFVKYIRQSKTEEARFNLGRIARGVADYHQAHRKAGPRFSFPPSTDWSPPARCCGQPDDRCAADPTTWQAGTWKALEFTVEDAHNFQYRYTSGGKGTKAHFVIEARADLDCDGTYSSYRVSGAVDGKGELKIEDPEVTGELE